MAREALISTKARNHAIRANLVELVDLDKDGTKKLGRESGRFEHTDENAAVVETEGAGLKPEAHECRCTCREELDLGERPRLAGNVNVALHELAVAALLRTLSTPHGTDLQGAEDGRQAPAVARDKSCKRHREVKTQAEVAQLERVAVLRSLRERILVEAAAHDRVRELLVVAAHPGVQSRLFFHDRGLDLVETMFGVHLANHGEDALAASLVGGQEVAHAARGTDLSGHVPIVSGCGEPRVRAAPRAGPVLHAAAQLLHPVMDSWVPRNRLE